MKRTLAFVVAGGLLAALTACGADSGQPDVVEPGQPDDVAVFVASDDEKDGMDCESDDKAKKEIPDCGFYAGPGNKTFYWWSWVKAGKVKPPAGWSPRREVQPYRTPTAATAPAVKHAPPPVAGKPASKRPASSVKAHR